MNYELKKALNRKEGTLSPKGRGPEHGRLRQIINMDAETTSGPLSLKQRQQEEGKQQTKKQKWQI